MWGGWESHGPSEEQMVAEDRNPTAPGLRNETWVGSPGSGSANRRDPDRSHPGSLRPSVWTYCPCPCARKGHNPWGALTTPSLLWPCRMMLKEQYIDKTRVAVFGKVSPRRAWSGRPRPRPHPRALPSPLTQP